MSRISFQIVAVLIVGVSFLFLFSHSRPQGVLRGVEPFLFATGLTQPRGLAFAQDGTLYVAEAGIAGPGETSAPGRISLLDARGNVTTLVAGLESASTAQGPFEQSGPHALLPNVPSRPQDTYVFSGPAPDAPLGVLSRLQADAGGAGLVPVASLAEQLARTTGSPSAPWGAARGKDGALYAVFPLANLLVRVRPGQDAEPAMASAVTSFVGSGQRNPMPTSVAVAPDGTIFVTLLGTEPYQAGAGRIVTVEPDGRWRPVYEGMTLPVSIAFGLRGELLALQFASGYDARAGRFVPRSGQLIRMDTTTNRPRTIVRDLNYPTSLSISPGGDVYVTENGTFSHAGEGRVLRVSAQTIQTFR